MDPFSDVRKHRKLATYGKRGRRIIQIDKRDDIFEPNITTDDLFGESLDKSMSPDSDFESKKTSRLTRKKESSKQLKENKIFKNTKKNQIYENVENIDSSPQTEGSLKLYDSVEDKKQAEKPPQLCVTKKTGKNVGKKKNCLKVKKKPARKKQAKIEHESISSQDSITKQEKSRHFSEFDSYDLKLESSGPDCVFESPENINSGIKKQSNHTDICKQTYNTSTPQHQDPAPISNLEENIRHELSFIKAESPADDRCSFIDIMEGSGRDSEVCKSIQNSTNDRNTPELLQEISSRLSQLNKMNSSTSLFEKNASQNIHECSKGTENDSKLANMIKEAPFVNKKRTRNGSKKYTVPIEESYTLHTPGAIVIEEENCEDNEKNSIDNRLSSDTYGVVNKSFTSKNENESPIRPHTPSLCTSIDPFKTPVSTMKTRNRVLEELRMSSQSFQEILTPRRSKVSGHVFTAMEKVLAQCEVSEPSSFGDCFTPSMYKNLKKVGEGVYGEVFKTERNRVSVAMKVIPIEGDFHVNDEPQKTFEEILPEIVITKELSNLSDSQHNCTGNFVHVNKVWLVQGKYPPALLKQWDSFHERKVSENDRPDIFKDNQLFIIFEFENAGDTLESFEFQNFETSRSILNQVALALAVAESELSFEHRDLHWGNVLIKKTKEKYISFILEGKNIDIETKGVQATIIDFTLSRLSKDNCSVFTDLSVDPALFEGQGDYQFEVYRLMQREVEDNWSSYHAYTNVLWIHYLGDKLLRNKNYKERIQADARAFRTLSRQALDYNSAGDLINNCPFFKESEDIVFQ